MQSQLKPNQAAPNRWRFFAFTFSASALALTLCAKPRASPPSPLPAAASASELELAPAAQGLRVQEPVNALGVSADGAALAALIAIARQGEPKLLSAALEGIAQIGGDQARQFLARRFDEATDAELPELAAALATLGDTPARALLQSAARSPRPMTRRAAFDALSTLDTADIREFMLQALADIEPSAAASYFQNCREPRALPALEQLARSGEASLQRTALDALFAQGASAEGALVRLLREDEELCDVMLQSQPSTPLARQALRRASIERLRAGALTTGWVFDFLQRDLSSDAREALLRAARDPASSESALGALSARGDSSSMHALNALANDVEQGLAQRAACALLSRPDSRSRPFLLRLNRGT